MNEDSNKFEKTFINQDNCPLNFDFLFQKPPSSSSSEKGYNVLHFNSKNRPVVSKGTKEFVEEKLKDAEKFESDAETLQNAVALSKELNKDTRNGVYIEFGFCTGRTINFIAALGYNKHVFGLDSGNGLPHDWSGKPTRFPKGTFLFKKKYQVEGGRMSLTDRDKNDTSPFIPFTPLPNVNLILGEIEDTLPKLKDYLKDNNLSIELLHIDTDLYESCKVVYDIVGELIVPEKTIVVLDEGYNWIGENNNEESWSRHELKATNEYANKNMYDINYLGYNTNHQQIILNFHE